MGEPGGRQVDQLRTRAEARRGGGNLHRHQDAAVGALAGAAHVQCGREIGLAAQLGAGGALPQGLDGRQVAGPRVHRQTCADRAERHHGHGHCPPPPVQARPPRDGDDERHPGQHDPHPQGRRGRPAREALIRDEPAAGQRQDDTGRDGHRQPQPQPTRRPPPDGDDEREHRHHLDQRREPAVEQADVHSASPGSAGGGGAGCW
nr:hypothetical protein [Mycolicibacterium mucogenicum]